MEINKEQIKNRIKALEDIKRPYFQYAIGDNCRTTKGCEYFGIIDYLDKEIKFSEHLLTILEE